MKFRGPQAHPNRPQKAMACPTATVRELKSALIFVVAFVALAQDATFHTTVPAVIAPTTVTDHKGKYVNGLTADDFSVLDNGVPQTIRLDTTDVTNIPIAMVFAVQTDDAAASAIQKIHKIGPMIQPLITGEAGHVAVVSYGSKVGLEQDFTSDPEEITRAFLNIKAESDRRAPMLDAVSNAVSMLHLRPSNERRIVVVVGETRDRGSKTKVADVLKMIQRESVTVFSLTYSAYLTPFTTKASELPPPEHQGDIIEIVTEMGRMAKTNGAIALAENSGGQKLSFVTLHSLEKLIGHVGEELHSQYLLSYTPPSRESGFHTISVRLRDRSGLLVRSRPGYWVDTE
jgi:VWFA-related protein